MLWKVWAAVVAVLCGVTVATAAGGSFSGSTYGLLAVTVAAGVVWTVVGRSRSGYHRVERLPRLQGRPTPKSVNLQTDEDREDVLQLLSLLPVREIDWLRTEGFATPWRESQVGSLRGPTTVRRSMRTSGRDIGRARYLNWSGSTSRQPRSATGHSMRTSTAC